MEWILFGSSRNGRKFSVVLEGIMGRWVGILFLFSGYASATELNVSTLLKSPTLVRISQATLAKPQDHSFTLYFYFASWCEYCKREVESLRSFHKQNEALRVVGISGDDSETEAKSVLRSWPIPFDAYWDSKQEFKNTFHFEKIPFSIVVSGEGKVILTHVSTSHFDKFLDSVKNVLSGRKLNALR
jgi:peroxiredoxin